MMFPQVHKLEAELRHKLFPPNAWMKVLHFNVLTFCPGPKDELHQWFIGLFGEHIIPAIVDRYTKVLQRPDLVTLDKDGNSHPLLSNEAVARVFKRLLTGFRVWCRTRPLKPLPRNITLAGPSLESAGFWSLKPKGYTDSPGLKRPGALQKPGSLRPGSVLLTRYDKHIPGIYLSYA